MEKTEGEIDRRGNLEVKLVEGEDRTREKE